MLILPRPLGPFQPLKPAPGGPRHDLSLGPTTRTASILLCPAAPSTFLGSHTGTLYIGVTSNLYLRVMQHKEGILEGFHCGLWLQTPALL